METTETLRAPTGRVLEYENKGDTYAPTRGRVNGGPWQDLASGWGGWLEAEEAEHLEDAGETRCGNCGDYGDASTVSPCCPSFHLCPSCSSCSGCGTRHDAISAEGWIGKHCADCAPWVESPEGEQVERLADVGEECAECGGIVCAQREGVQS